MQARIMFIASGANSVYGGFTAGDKLNCSEAMANHLVEIGVAKFIDEKQVESQPEPVKPRKKGK